MTGRLSQEDKAILRRASNPDLRKQKMAWSTLFIGILALAGPILIFINIVSIAGFAMHRSADRAMWAIIGLYAFGFLLYAFLYNKSSKKKIHHGKKTFANVKWHNVLHIMIPTAIVWATIAGDDIYFKYMEPFYTMNDLASYVNVNPAKERGQSYMDAGQIFFKEGSRVSTAEARAYQDRHTYCVAPIVGQPLTTAGEEAELFKLPPSGTVDFWAVGIDCCLPSGEQFKCHDVGNGAARSGFRLLRDDQRVFFKMAVQEWSAEYNLPVKHPLFFYWVQDPVADTGVYQLNAGSQYYMSVSTFCLVHLVVFYLCWFFDPNFKNAKEKAIMGERDQQRENMGVYGSAGAGPSNTI